MTKYLRIVLLLLAVTALTYVYTAYLWSVSVDLPHHYSLVARLAEHGNAAFPFDRSLAEMNVYPRLSHQVAAIAAKLAGSPLMGMTQVAVASAALLWAGLVWIILDLPRRMAIALAVSLAALLALNRHVLHLPVHGDEVVDSYFYAQLVGQTLCIGALLLAFQLERNGTRSWVRYALLVPALCLLTNVHLLPTLMLLMVMGLMIAADLVVVWREERQSLLRACLAGAILWLAGLATVVLQPAFRAMQSLSNHNGDMYLPYLADLAALMYYCGGIAIVSALLLWRSLRPQWRKELAALRYLSLYGLAASCLCLLQGVALKMGFGSEYAIRKYAFALNTAALLEVAVLPALLLFRRPQASAAGPRMPLLHCALPALLTMLAVMAIMHKPTVHQMAQLVKLEGAVMSMRTAAHAAPDKASYVIGTDGGTALTEYMLSIAHLHVPRMENINAFSLLAARDIANWPAVDKILTSENGGFDQLRDCRTAPPQNGLVVVDGQCLVAAARAETRIAFMAGNKVFLCTLKGFSPREAAGTWTDGDTATLRCPVPRSGGKPFKSVALTAAPYNSRGNGQRVLMALDGQPAKQVLFNAGRQTEALPLAQPVPDEIVMHLALPDAVSPQQLGLAADGRRLGISVQAIEFRE